MKNLKEMIETMMNGTTIHATNEKGHYFRSRYEPDNTDTYSDYNTPVGFFPTAEMFGCTGRVISLHHALRYVPDPEMWSAYERFVYKYRVKTREEMIRLLLNNPDYTVNQWGRVVCIDSSVEHQFTTEMWDLCELDVKPLSDGIWITDRSPECLFVDKWIVPYGGEWVRVEDQLNA